MVSPPPGLHAAPPATRSPAPPSGPGTATQGMSPAAFEAWAVSVEDYSIICGWSPPLAASYVRLLCDGALQQRIDARFDKQAFRQLPTTAAIDVVRSVVVGQRCEVGAWSDLFAYSQEPGDSVDAYVARCRALAAECNFRCPECNSSLTEYMLSRKVVMGLSDRSMKAEVLWYFPRLSSVSDVVNQCEIIEAADTVAGRQAARHVAALAGAPTSTSHPPQSPDPPATPPVVLVRGTSRNAAEDAGMAVVAGTTNAPPATPPAATAGEKATSGACAVPPHQAGPMLPPTQ